MENRASNPPPVLYVREAEQCLISALFSDRASEVYNQLALTSLVADDFYVSAYRMAFVAVGELISRGGMPDRSTLAAYLKARPDFTESVAAEITEAISTSWSDRNLSRYADAVIERARARKISQGLAHLQSRAALIGGDLRSEDVVREIDAVSLQLGERSATNGLLRSPSDHLEAMVKKLDAKQNGEVGGISTGIPELDEILGPLEGGDLVIIAGRPGMGKTALALHGGLHNCAISVPGIGAPLGKKPFDPAEVPMGAFFTLEMPEEQLTQREIACMAGVPFKHVRAATFTDDEWARVVVAFEQYARCDLRIDSSSWLTPAILRAKVRLLERQTGKKLRFIIIDYLQLMAGDERHQNRNSEIAEISRKLKLLAKEFNVPIIALSQLNRELERRTDRRPVMSDLRESGAIEQDADIVLFVYRDEYYNPDTLAKGIAEIIVGKARNSSTGVVPARFDPVTQQFSGMPAGGHTYESSYGH
jgi:replicative DNA helicase